jgi:hypothetical protein
MRDGHAGPRRQRPEKVRCGSDAGAKTLHAFRSEISSSRIVALALERMPYTWLIGKKVYDPEKIRVFLESIWSRITILEDGAGAHELEFLLATARRVTGRLKVLKNEPAAGGDSGSVAEQVFIDLRTLTAGFLSLYFRLKELRSADAEGLKRTALGITGHNAAVS